MAQIFTGGSAGEANDQIFEEAVRLKQQNYELKDEVSRLKTRIKMHDAEMLRKEKAIEDFC